MAWFYAICIPFHWIHHKYVLKWCIQMRSRAGEMQMERFCLWDIEQKIITQRVQFGANAKADQPMDISPHAHIFATHLIAEWCLNWLADRVRENVCAPAGTDKWIRPKVSHMSAFRFLVLCIMSAHITRHTPPRHRPFALGQWAELRPEMAHHPHSIKAWKVARGRPIAGRLMRPIGERYHKMPFVMRFRFHKAIVSGNCAWIVHESDALALCRHRTHTQLHNMALISVHSFRVQPAATGPQLHFISTYSHSFISSSHIPWRCHLNRGDVQIYRYKANRMLKRSLGGNGGVSRVVTQLRRNFQKAERKK